MITDDTKGHGMHKGLFILLLGLLLFLLFRWAFRHLPNEKWQILAVIPRHKTDARYWQGLNLTYYGFFIASAYTFALAILLVLLHTTGMDLIGVGFIMLAMLAVCLPAARIIARIIEKQPGTLTVAGASFVGLLLLPGLVYLTNQTLGRWMDFHISLQIMLAAVSTAYAFGEGIGRLACISFGCCYGKPLESCSVQIQSLFRKFHLVFTGPTKKAAYTGNLEGKPVVPIQALTAIVCCLAGLAGSYLFLSGFFMTAALLTFTVTQGWRLLSEIWRADYRGGQRFSAYQRMAVASLLYMIPVLLLTFSPDLQPADIAEGLKVLWQPETIIGLQLVWTAVFLYTGRSEVTTAGLEFFVEKKYIGSCE
jgi:prolipoprotein diacylglyceryltransferase